MSSGSMKSGDDFETAPTHDNEEERFCPSCEISYPDGFDHCPDDGTKLVHLRQAPDPMIGRIIDNRFVIRERLGAGGMGAVYRALQKSMGREIAIKVIESKLSRDRTAAKRFLREAKLSSALSQPNTVSVLDFGQTTDGMLFLAMELIQGRTLGAVLKAEGAFSAKRTVRVGVQLCDALDAAHSLSIIHRDLKPSNIIVLDHPPGRDLIKVLDFGLAKSLAGDSTNTTVTQSDVLLGTPSYISPEVVKGTGEDARTDLYSVGVILYELISGQLPFVADNVNTLLAMHAYDAPPRLEGVHEAIAKVIYKLLEKERASRYPDAATAREALTEALEAAKRAGAVSDSGKRGRKTETAQAVRSEAFAQTVATEEPAGLTAPDTPAQLRAAKAKAKATEAAVTESPRRRGALLAALGVAVVGGGLAAAAALGMFGSDGAQKGDNAAPAAAPATMDAGPAAAPMKPAATTATAEIDAGPVVGDPKSDDAKTAAAAKAKTTRDRARDRSKSRRRSRRARPTKPKKVEPKKVEPKKVEPKKVEPKKTEPKKKDPDIDFRLPGSN